MHENLTVLIVDVMQTIQIPEMAQQIGGSSLLNHVLRVINNLSTNKIIIISNNDKINKSLDYCNEIDESKIELIMQTDKVRTKPAIEVALPFIPHDTNNILILHSNTPLITCESIKKNS